jgi:pimeloyl-ACP methyl ester carboxylesterase
MTDFAFGADGIPIAHEAMGTGVPTLVFVHGWSCDRRYWRGQVDHFAARRQVVAIDLAGHGDSGAGRSAWTMAAFGDDVIAVVNRLELGELVLIGHSMGGDVIVEAALQLGDRVIGLVWVDTYTDLDHPLDLDEIERFAAPFREDFVSTTRNFVRRMFLPHSDPGLVEWVAADMSAAPREVAVDALPRAIGNIRAIPRLLERLSAPLVAINPDHRPTDIESLHRHGVTTRIMSGVAHFLMMEDPSGFNALLDDVVNEFTR